MLLDRSYALQPDTDFQLEPCLVRDARPVVRRGSSNPQGFAPSRRLKRLTTGHSLEHTNLA